MCMTYEVTEEEEVKSCGVEGMYEMLRDVYSQWGAAPVG